jgi:protein TonB
MNQHLSRDIIQKRMSRQGIRPADEGLLGSSNIRLMLGWVFSLGLITAVVNLPLYSGKGSIGWRSSPPSEQIMLLPAPPKKKKVDRTEGSPITVFVQPQKVDDPLPDVKKKGNEEIKELLKPTMKPQKLERVNMGPILEFVDENPVIVGGLSTLYLNIDYPQSARDQGIEGLTVLQFIVEKDGSTRDVNVLKPLYPTLDSAAVAAVRKTIFKPGRQEGKIVRVKMRLPIRFRIVDPSKQKKAVDSLAANQTGRRP